MYPVSQGMAYTDAMCCHAGMGMAYACVNAVTFWSLKLKASRYTQTVPTGSKGKNNGVEKGEISWETDNYTVPILLPCKSGRVTSAESTLRSGG